MNDGGEVNIGEPAALAPPAARTSLTRWLHEGLRALAFRAPRWERVATGPALLALLVALRLLVTIGVGRLYYDAGARFNWSAATAGWVGLLLTAWACYVMRPVPVPAAGARAAPSAAHLLTAILTLSLWVSLVYGLLYAGAAQTQWFGRIGKWGHIAAYVVPIAWVTLAILVLLIRSGERGLGRRLAAVYAIVIGATVSYYLAPAPSFWTEQAGAQAETEAETEPAEPLSFTQELIEAQPPLLARAVSALAPQRPGIADMYTITFAPFEGEEVFRRESRMVAEVMARRFDAAGRGLQLMNHADEIDRAPWATPLNLQRAVAGVARTMDKNEDLLFIHLTSHGADDGELAASFYPLDVAPVTPAALKGWLDEAGIRHRVISVSACYAGNWIAPLAGDDTLVMTASDADHTSYGCGKKSELTFFGRAMYDEQLRSKTLSFEQAHAAARPIIDQREKAAGKDDGYSNPQIKVGSRIGPYLAKMRARLGG